MIPSAIAMSAVSICDEKTLMMRPLLRTRSAGASPRATRSSRVVRSSGDIERNALRFEPLVFWIDGGFAGAGFDSACDPGAGLDEDSAALVDRIAADDAAVDNLGAAIDGQV